jgi:protein-S-isoprenylcysteine O-methyltransferase Ste14
MLEKQPGKRTFWAITLLYLLIGLEIVYMISPFGLYYYSVYGEGLDFLNEHQLTAWLCAFFLPHIAHTSSWVLESFKSLGWVLAVLGFVGFLIAAVPIYVGKLRGGGPVVRGIYRYVRHPQYTSLILCSFGLLLVWPRNIVMISFLAMTFAYYFLAKTEEKECSAKFGPAFDAYVQRTGMFLPFDSWLRQRLWALPQRGVRRTVAVLGCFVGALVLGLALAHGARLWSVRSLYTAYGDDAAIVSLVPLDQPAIRKAVRIARTDPNVATRVRAATTDVSKFLIYVMPSEWSESDIPMNTAGRHGHHEPPGWDRNRLKILIMQAIVDRGTAPTGTELLLSVRDRKPIVEVTVALNPEQVLTIEKPPETVRWGGIPTPIF